MPKSDTPEGESFAALFEQQSKSTPRARMPRVGDVLEAIVVQVGRDTVFVELDGKRQAFIEAEELRAPDGTLTTAVGETLRARVVEVDAETGNVRLGRSLGRPGTPAAIEQARESGIAIEGKVVAVNKGGLEVEVAGARAFCPISQADSKYVQDPSSFVGRALQFLVTDVRDGGKSVVLSRRALLEREAKEAGDRIKRDLKPGALVKGTVTNVREFGAFVDIGGIEGLIPASELGHGRRGASKSGLTQGEAVEVQIREVKESTSPKGEPVIKITLSLQVREDERANFTGFREQAAAKPTLGTFGDLLQKRGTPAPKRGR